MGPAVANETGSDVSGGMKTKRTSFSEKREKYRGAGQSLEAEHIGSTDLENSAFAAPAFDVVQRSDRWR